MTESFLEERFAIRSDEKNVAVGERIDEVIPGIAFFGQMLDLIGHDS